MKMFPLTGSALAVLLAASVFAQDRFAGSDLPPPSEAPLAADPMKVTVHRLENGLTVYLSPNAQEPRITAWIGVRAGSRHDPLDSTGMAHYLEHMLFKGTARLGTLDFAKEKLHLDRILALYEKRFALKDAKAQAEIYKEIDRENIQAVRYASPNELDKAYSLLGFNGLNAFTSQEQTVYTCSLPKNRLESWAAVESDRFPNAVFRLFQTEIEAVYEERNLYADDPERRIHAALNEALWGAHPLAHPIEGTAEHLKNPSLAKMYAFHRRNYVPNNMAVVLAGDFDRERAVELVRRRFGGWKPGPPPQPTPLPPEPLRGVLQKELRFEAEEKVFLAWHTVPANHADEDALTAMDMVFDNSRAGLVNLGLVQAQKVKAAGSYPDFNLESGAWQLWAVPKEGQTLEAARDLLLETVGRVQRGEFSEEDLRSIVLNFEIDEKRRLESNDARAAAMMMSFMRREDWARSAGRIERLRKVTRDDVIRVAKKYLGGDRAEVLRRRGKPENAPIAKPNFTKVAIDPDRASSFFKELVAAPAAPIEPRWLVEGRDYRVRRSPWGTLYSAKNPVNDLFELDLHFERGRRHERELCGAIGLLNLSGGGKMTAEEFKRELYRLGTSLDVSCGEQDSGIHLSGLEANLERSLELMRSHLREPRVERGALEKMIQVQVGARKDSKVNPDSILGALAEWARYGKDSEVLRELTDSELKGLREGRLTRLIRDILSHERRVAYVGTRDAEDVERLLDDGLKAYAPIPPREIKRYVRPPSDRLLLLDREMVQVKLGLFTPDGEYDPARAVEAQYFNEYMGGMSGVVWQQVRESRALAYVAYGAYRTGSRKGEENRASAWVETQADKAVEAAGLIRALMSGLPVEEKRFAEARAAIEQSYRTETVHFRNVPDKVMDWEDLGLSGDPRPERMQRAMAYTLPELSRFAGRFSAGPWTFFLMGDKGKLDLPALRGLGALEERTVDQLFPY